jgi:hypothetical protein
MKIHHHKTTNAQDKLFEIFKVQQPFVVTIFKLLKHKAYGFSKQNHLLATSFGEGKFIRQPNLFDGHKLAMPLSLKVLQREIPKGLKTLLTMELVNNWIKFAMEGHR